MPSRRDQIQMTDEEARAFLAEQRVMQVATIGPRGWPHVVSLWYVLDGLHLRGWTYAKSQKARNLERDPRATISVEDGVEYHELRGVTIESEVHLERDVEQVAEYGLALAERYGGAAPEMQDAFRKQATKRVGLLFIPRRVITWDHSKLGGVY